MRAVGKWQVPHMQVSGMAPEQTPEWAGLDLRAPGALIRVHVAEVGLQGGSPSFRSRGPESSLHPRAPFPPTPVPVPFSHLLLTSPHLRAFFAPEMLGQHQPSPAESCQSLQLRAFILVFKWSRALPIRQRVVERPASLWGVRSVVLRVSVTTGQAAGWSSAPSDPLLGAGCLRCADESKHLESRTLGVPFQSFPHHSLS